MTLCHDDSIINIVLGIIIIIIRLFIIIFTLDNHDTEGGLKIRKIYKQ